MLFLLSGASSGGGPAAITLGTGDLTTEWRKHLDALHVEGGRLNEGERVALTTAYSISGATDLSTVVSRFLKTRTAP